MSGDLATARAEAERARARLLQSAHDLQARVAPARLAGDAIEGAKERGTAAVESVTDTVRRRPEIAAAVAAGLLGFLARRRIARLFRRKPKAEPTTLATAKRPALPRLSGDRK